MKNENENEIETDAAADGAAASAAASRETTEKTVVKPGAAAEAAAPSAAASVSISFSFSFSFVHFPFSFFISILFFSFIFATDGSIGMLEHQWHLNWGPRTPTEPILSTCSCDGSVRPAHQSTTSNSIFKTTRSCKPWENTISTTCIQDPEVIK